MFYPELNRVDAAEKYNSLVEKGIDSIEFDDLNKQSQQIRNYVLNNMPSKITKTYEFDLRFALVIHKCFSQTNIIDDFNDALASNYDFWRYICIKVFPDIIFKRHGFVKEYFYYKNVRMYIPALWWFIEFGFQGDYERTYEALKNLSTDFIVNIIERTGKGIYKEVMQYILYYFSKLSKSSLNSKGEKPLIKRLMLQNTARINNYNPVIQGETKEYVKELFRKCGVEINDE